MDKKYILTYSAFMNQFTFDTIENHNARISNARITQHFDGREWTLEDIKSALQLTEENTIFQV